MITKHWILMKDNVDLSEVEFLAGLGVEFEVDRPEHTFTISRLGRPFTAMGKPTYHIRSTTEEQESMLVLKYGNQLILKDWVNDKWQYK